MIYFIRCFLFILLFFICLTNQLAMAAKNVRVEITGVAPDAIANINSALNIDLQNYSDTLTSSQVQSFYNDAPTIIRKALEPYGYFESRIYSAKYVNRGVTTLKFIIQPGTPVLISSVNINVIGPGKDNPKIQAFLLKFPLKKGQVLNTEQYEKAKNDFFEVVNNQGYLKATLDKKELRIHLPNKSADIIWTLNTGPQYYFGPVTFGKNPFDPDFLNRLITFNQNEPFSSEKLLKFQQDLNASKYVSNATVSPELDNTENYHVPTHIDLTVPKAQFYNLGVGYGTFTGPRVTMGMDLRRVTDTGQHFNAQIKYSSVLKGLAAKYFIPGHQPLTEQYTVGANIQEFHPKNGHSFSETISASYVKIMNKWTHTFSLNLLNERFKNANNPWERSHLLYPSYNLTHITADNIINPKFGNSFNITFQGSSEQIFSTTSFLQTEAKDKFIFSPTELSRVILRADLGYTVVNDLDQLPLTLNFFAGGINSVRGYAFSSLGPGRYLEVASAELQHRIYGNWNGAIFYDVGNAVNHFNDPLMRGEGIGIIYTSPIGPVQIYLARAESKPGKPLSVEFTIGPDF